MSTPVITNTQLGWATMSTVQSNILPVTSFLKGLFFRRPAQNLPTESVELSYLEGHQKMAPFVEVNSEAIAVEGNSTVFANVSTPNIRIKRPMEAYNVFLRRQPGTGIFISGGNVIARARRAAMAEDQETMSRMVERREEWMVSQFIAGADTSNLILTYTVDEAANFTVTVPRPANHVVAAAATWATAATPIDVDIQTGKRTMAKSGQAPTHMILGSTAAASFLANTSVRALINTASNINAGDLTLMTQFSDAGAIYLGRYMGLSVWEYSGEYLADGSGTPTAHIGATVALLLNASASNAAQFYYGAIPDHDAFDQGLFVGKRFSKATKTFDPSSYVQLLHTRPLPMVRKPASIYYIDTDASL